MAKFVSVVLALLSVGVSMAYGGAGWMLPLPADLFLLTSGSAINGDTYVLMGVTSLLGVSITNRSVSWQQNLPPGGPIYDVPIASSISLNPPNNVAVVSVILNGTEGKTEYQEIALNSGVAVWTTTETFNFSSRIDAAGDVVIGVNTNADGDTRLASVLNPVNGAVLWQMNETAFTTQGLTSAVGIATYTEVHFNPFDKKDVQAFRLVGLDSNTGARRWTVDCTSVLATSTDRTLIAVSNTTAYSILNTSTRIDFVLRVTGTIVASMKLKPNQIAEFGIFSTVAGLVITDALSYVEAYSLQGLRWTISLFDVKGYRLLDSVTLMDAGDHVLVLCQAAQSANISAPTPSNVTAIDARNGTQLATVSFSSAEQNYYPLLNGHLLVVPFTGLGYSIYSLVTGALVETSSVTVSTGSVQVTSSGSLLLVTVNNTDGTYTLVSRSYP